MRAPRFATGGRTTGVAGTPSHVGFRAAPGNCGAAKWEFPKRLQAAREMGNFYGDATYRSAAIALWLAKPTAGREGPREKR